MEFSGNADTREKERNPTVSLTTTQSKRKLLTDQKQLVTSEQLAKTRFDIKNLEHSKLAFEILKKPSSQRFDEELQLLMEVFQDITFFQRMQNDLDSETYVDLFRQLKAKRFRAGETIFNFGDWGEDFYIIIQGSVYILLKKQDAVVVPEDKQQTEPKEEENKILITGNQANHARKHVASKTLAPKFAKDDQKHATMSPDSFKLAAGTFEEGVKKADTIVSLEEEDDGLLFPENAKEEEQRLRIQEKKPYLFIGRVMKEGDSFGEIALQNRTRRTATVVCKEPTILGVLTRKQYNRILCNDYPKTDKVYAKKDEEDLQFLKGFGLFSHMNHQKLREVFLQMNRLELIKNKCLYQEGDRADRIYFIRNGEIEISQKIDPTEFEEKNHTSIGPQPQSQKFKHKFFVGSRHETKSRVRLSLLSKGLYFGLEEVLEKCPRKSTATVVSLTAEVYYIEKDRFNRIVLDKEVLERATGDAKLRSSLQKMLISGVVKANHFQAESLANHNKKLKELGRSMTISHPEAPVGKHHTNDLSMQASTTENLPYLARASLNTNYIHTDDPLSPTSPGLGLRARLTTFDSARVDRISSPKNAITEYNRLIGGSLEDVTQPILSPKAKAIPSMAGNIDDDLESRREKFGTYFRTNEYYKNQLRILSPIAKDSTRETPTEKSTATKADDPLNSHLSLSTEPNSALDKKKKIRKYLLERDYGHSKNTPVKEVSPRSDIENYRRLCKVLKIDKIVKGEGESLGSLTFDDENNHKSAGSLGHELSLIFDGFRKESTQKPDSSQNKDTIVTTPIPHGLTTVLPRRTKPANSKVPLLVSRTKSPTNSGPVLPIITGVKSASSLHLVK